MTSLPRLAMVSTDLRRDLLAPLRYFTEFDLIHLYRHASYGDLTAEDMTPNLCVYSTPLELYSQLVQERPDVIQGVEPLSLALQPYVWACYLAARRVHARLLVVTLENRPLRTKYGGAIAFLLRRLLRLYFSSACVIFALNDGAQRNLRSCGIPNSRMRSLMWGTWGVDLDEFRPAGQNMSAPTVLFAGRLLPEKGIFVLLDAFANVRSQLPQARLVIVGDGPARSRVQERAVQIEGVELCGVVKNREMPRYLNSAHVLAMPSLTTRRWEEQVGMVAIQGMACGVPIVATQSGAIPEYVPAGTAGLLVPENDAGALSEALVRVLTDPMLREKLGRGGRAFAVEHYDARKNVRLAELTLKEFCLAGRI